MARDRAFRYAVLFFGLIVIGLAAAICIELAFNSKLAWKTFGWKFLVTSTWDPVQEVYGALPFVYGTLMSSALAILMAVPLGVGSAVFLAGMGPRRGSGARTLLVGLLAAVSRVVFGLVGIFILVPTMASVEPFLIKHLGFIPLFSGSPNGVGLLTAGLILTIMILPYITSISRDVILAVPTPLKE